MDHQMRTSEERIRQLHRRARELEKARELRQLAGLGGLSAFCAVLLIGVMVQTRVISQSVTGDSFAGSSLLSDSAGGYILTAVGAFFGGVILTAVIYRKRNRR